MRQSPPANFLQVRRGAPSPQHRLKRANQTPIPAESARPLTLPELTVPFYPDVVLTEQPLLGRSDTEAEQ